MMIQADRRLIDAMLAMGFFEDETMLKETDVQQFAVFMEAYMIFRERNGRYNDEWRVTGWKGALFELRKKVSRVWRVFWKGTATKPDHLLYDDALDAINFIVFFIRLHRENGLPWGEWER